MDKLTLAQLFFSKSEAHITDEIGGTVILVCIIGLEHECVRPDYVMVTGYDKISEKFKCISVKVS